jgi:hypothetical protein
MTTHLDEPSWIVRALERARSLEGRDWTEREEEVIQAYEKHGYKRYEAVFMAFGVRPETKGYVQSTVEILEEAQQAKDIRTKREKLVTGWVRLCWCCEAIIGGVHK